MSVSPGIITPKSKLVGFTLITDGSKPVPISPTKKFGSSVSFETNVIADELLVVGVDKSEDVVRENDDIVMEDKGMGPGEANGGEKRAGARP